MLPFLPFINTLALNSYRASVDGPSFLTAIRASIHSTQPHSLESSISLPIQGHINIAQVGLKFINLPPLEFWDYNWVTATSSSTSSPSKERVMTAQVPPVPSKEPSKGQVLSKCQVNT